MKILQIKFIKETLILLIIMIVNYLYINFLYNNHLCSTTCITCIYAMRYISTT